MSREYDAAVRLFLCILIMFFTLILFYAATSSFALQSYVLGCAAPSL